jgi:two-component system chemotaxis response regulator CheB
VNRDIVVVGASAGGIEALQQLVRGLPHNFAGSVFITVHFPEHGTSVLPRILTRVGKLPALHATDGESIVPGRIYVAPPDYHLLLTPSVMRIVRGPKENGNRPAVDPMFRSAAVAFGPRVIAVVLTGNLDDGTSGARAVKRRGGYVIVQDPEDALFPSMPQSVRDHVIVDRVAPIRAMARVIEDAMSEPIPETLLPPPNEDVMENELSAANLDAIGAPESQHPGVSSPYSCPDCGGVLWELKDGDFTRYRCRVGHSWTGDALLAKQADVLDDALWIALRTLEESASLSRKLADRHRERGATRLAERFADQAESLQARARVIRDALMSDRDPQVNADVAEANPRRASAS